MVRFFDNSQVAIDNTPAEQVLHGVAVGRKNDLFAGSGRSARRAAAFNSLMGTAKLNGLDPDGYRGDVLGCMADHPASHLAEMLPWRWTPPNAVAHTA